VMGDVLQTVIVEDDSRSIAVESSS